MDVRRPHAAIAEAVDLDVLVSLARTNEPKTGRELARLSGRSSTGVHHVLDRLVEHGLVARASAGRAFLYTLNRQHLLAPAVEVMAAARAELLERLRDLVGSWDRSAVQVSLFGSAARSDGDTESDIDLFVVRPAEVDVEDELWRAQIDDLADHVHAWTGNHAGIAEVGSDEIERLAQDRPPVVEELIRDAIDLGGEPARRVLRGG